jgi:hypothetical protein
MIKAKPGISRRELSRQVCRLNGWRSPNGNLKDMSCRKALVELERRGVIALPLAKSVANFAPSPPSGVEVDVPLASLALADMGEVTVEPIGSRYTKASKLWRTLLERHHYLGAGPLCGAQIRYIVKSSNYGYVGALAFTSATWALKDRDEHIGWSEGARRANLDKVVLNARFLLVPTLKVANLASYVLSLTLSRLPKDWEERYCIRPVLVETFVDPERFAGVCYRAANWQHIGQTAGRRDGKRKNILVYPLAPSWREILCREPEIKLGETPRIENPTNWAEEEFGSVRFYDPRLKRRLYTIAQDFFAKCEKNIPEACGSKAKTMGAYRFFQNKEVSMEVILNAHTEATIERIKNHRVVLAPQDTTILDYSTHPMTEGLGPTNGIENNTIGLILHDTVAFTENGTPLGVIDAQCWARDLEDKGKSRRRKELPIEQKESVKWLRSFQKLAQVQKLCPQTTLVSIGDRESDIYELFFAAMQSDAGPKLLIRAEQTRSRLVEEEPLWNYMAAREADGTLQIHIARQGGRKGRVASAEVRFAEVELSPPKRYASHPSLKLWAVYLVETEASEDVTPIEWMLLTTAEVKTFKDAQTRVEWYAMRWRIEVYHRVLKSGCRIEDRQLGTAESIETCLGVDMVVAWRIYHLTMLGRETPDVDCTVFFSDVEWKALCCYVTKTPTPPKKPPSLKEAISMVATMGGFLGRNRDGHPGTTTLWRGLQRLDTASEMYGIIRGEEYVPPWEAWP